VSVKPVAIVGGGLAGLCCARTLVHSGIDVVLVEAQHAFGGRVQTDLVDGFRLDRGFQVLQTAYPEARKQLDYTTLGLKNFEPGALILTHGKTVRMSDPWRRPLQLFSTAFNEIGDFADRMKLARLRWSVTHDTIKDIWTQPDSTTFDYLRTTCGFSSDMIERFFRPWFSGVFFEKELNTSSRFFKFIFRMFSVGDAALPEQGMGAIPRQLAEGLPSEMYRLSSRVTSVDGLTVRLESGEVIQNSAIVLAVEGPEASRLSGGQIASPESRSTTCFYFAAPTPPITDSLLILNGDQSGPINNLCVPSNVAPSYAPRGQSLVSVSVIGRKASATTELELDVRRQLREWYGSEVDRWLTLPSYYIRHALPGQLAHFRDHPALAPKLAEGLYHCGDYCETASIHGAMVNGRRAAEAVLADLKIRKV
jgi:phytoene dehydrogenase-like protein